MVYMITNNNTARRFAISIKALASGLALAIVKKDWEEASDLLDLIESDVEKLRGYANRKFEEAEKARAEEKAGAEAKAKVPAIPTEKDPTCVLCDAGEPHEH